MEAVASMFRHYKAEGFHVFVELSHDAFDAYDNPLDGLEVHSTKLLRDIWIISNYELLNKFLHSSMLVFP